MRACVRACMGASVRACERARALAWGSVLIHVFFLRSKIPSTDKEVGVKRNYVVS